MKKWSHNQKWSHKSTKKSQDRACFEGYNKEKPLTECSVRGFSGAEGVRTLPATKPLQGVFYGTGRIFGILRPLFFAKNSGANIDKKLKS